MTIDGKQDPAYIGPEHQLTSHSETKQASGKKRIWLWIVVLLVFALVLFLILHQQSETKETGGRRGFGGPVSVTPATATTGDIGVYLESIGTVTPIYTASITSQVTGQVIAVHYREGQVVRKGDPLVEIDPRPYEATLAEAQGTLQHDQGVLEQAKMDLDRYRKAWAANAIPKQTLDDQEKVVLQDEGTVKNDEGTVQFDQVQVGFCHIVSPINGRVGLRLVDPGNVVQSGNSTVLAVVTQMQPITVISTIPEDSLGSVQAQLRKGAKLSVDALDRTGENKLGTGMLTSVDNQIDTTTGTVKLRAQFDNRDQSLFPNAFVNSKLLVTMKHGVVLLPTSAIQHNGDATYVYVLAKAPPQAASGTANANGGSPQGGQPTVAGAPASNGTPAVGGAPSTDDGAKGGKKNGDSAAGQQHQNGPSYVAQMRTVKAGTTTGLVTEVQGVNSGEMVANSSFDKLQAGSKVFLSKQQLPGDSTESNAP
jgi:membrane fusion protein, multidrug efflux system